MGSLRRYSLFNAESMSALSFMTTTLWRAACSDTSSRTLSGQMEKEARSMFLGTQSSARKENRYTFTNPNWIW